MSWEIVESSCQVQDFQSKARTMAAIGFIQDININTRWVTLPAFVCCTGLTKAAHCLYVSWHTANVVQSHPIAHFYIDIHTRCDGLLIVLVVLGATPPLLCLRLSVCQTVRLLKERRNQYEVCGSRRLALASEPHAEKNSYNTLPWGANVDPGNMHDGSSVQYTHGFMVYDRDRPRLDCSAARRR